MFIIKTHNNNSNFKADFYIICKGDNAGQPVKEATANCFDLIVINKEILLVDYAFLLVLNAHNQNAFKKYINGSVVPFITISDFKTAFFEFYSTSK
jgi:hypothetical protein